MRRAQQATGMDLDEPETSLEDTLTWNYVMTDEEVHFRCVARIDWVSGQTHYVTEMMLDSPSPLGIVPPAASGVYAYDDIARVPRDPVLSDGHDQILTSSREAQLRAIAAKQPIKLDGHVKRLEKANLSGPRADTVKAIYASIYDIHHPNLPVLFHADALRHRKVGDVGILKLRTVSVAHAVLHFIDPIHNYGLFKVLQTTEADAEAKALGDGFRLSVNQYYQIAGLKEAVGRFITWNLADVEFVNAVSLLQLATCIVFSTDLADLYSIPSLSCCMQSNQLDARVPGASVMPVAGAASSPLKTVDDAVTPASPVGQSGVEASPSSRVRLANATSIGSICVLIFMTPDLLLFSHVSTLMIRNAPDKQGILRILSSYIKRVSVIVRDPRHSALETAGAYLDVAPSVTREAIRVKMSRA